MKQSKRNLIALSLLGACLALSSCGGNEKTNRESEGQDSSGNWTGTLNVALFDGGYGTKYMQNVIEGFKAKNPKVNVTFTPYESRDTIFSDLSASDDMQLNDVYFLESADMFKAASMKNAFPLGGHDEALVELSDVYAAKNEGESKSVGEKIAPESKEYSTVQWGERKGKSYMIPYGVTVSGVSYNHDVVDKYLSNGALPRTTDEFYSLCQQIQSGETSTKNFSSIVYAAGNTAKQYWQEPYYAWWAQYDGIEAFNQFHNGRAYDEDSGSWIHSASIFTLPGRKASFEAAYRFLNPDAGLTSPNTMQSYRHFDAQTQLLTGRSAFMMNSGWLENEMTISMYTPEQIEGKLGMMRYPVLSSIIDKTPSIKDDATLSKVIASIDAGNAYASRGDALSGVSEADYAKVEEARGVSKLNSTINFGVIPTTAKNKNLGKEFLKYLYSDEGIALYSKATPGCFLPVKGFDYSAVSEIKESKSKFLKDCLSMISDGDWVWPHMNNSIVYSGGLSGVELPNDGSLEVCFGKEGMTVEEAFNKLPQMYAAKEAYEALMAKADQ